LGESERKMMEKASEQNKGKVKGGDKGKLTWESGRIMMEKSSEQSKGEEEWGDKGKANMGEWKNNDGERQ
jgi:hypothetical protein